MLKIIKKEEILPEVIPSKYTLQYEMEQKILKVVRQTEGNRLPNIQQLIADLPSIASPTLSETIHKIIAGINESNIEDSLSLILKLLALHHDERQLRHYLKHKFKVDAQILLFILWERRDEKLTLYLVNIILDCYTVQLMLNGKEIVQQWSNYIVNRVHIIQCKEQIQAKLSRKKQQNGKVSNGSFRNILIPL